VTHPIDIENWLQQINPEQNLELIQQAASLAQLAGETQATPYGESCLQQGLAMAEILNALHLDSETLAASIVYSSAQYADLSPEDIEEHLGGNVAKLINLTKQLDGISELYEAVAHHEYHHPKIDNIRKMLLAMVDDVRAVLIKLAERLCALRSAKILSEQSKQQLAAETMAIYAPLANRFGIWHIKWELEDLAFRYLQPQKYQEISKALSERRIDRDKYVEQMINSLTTLLTNSGISNLQVTGRAKHIYSIYRKMQRKNVDFNEIYDATALRVIVPTIEDCYTVLSNVHSTWKHLPQEFDDYIATPKPNGYKSIHTAIIDHENKYVEIQIRTSKMHEESELGVAAHWVCQPPIFRTGFK
jgi:GTP pyrophosphokinase